MSNSVSLTLDQAYQLSAEVLQKNGFSPAHADVIARVICACQRDECHSHGLYRLLICIRTLNAGRVSPDAIPEVFDQSPGIVRVDAKGGYSLLAYEAGRPQLIEKARRNGLAALSINHCYHFSALWPEVEALSHEGLAALAMTPSHRWVAPAGGTKPVFGTNPIAFAWPRPNGLPFVFDFATSAVARGEIELHRRAGKDIPFGWALDPQGQPTTDPAAGLAGAMLPFGGYKGSALSMMIELLAGPLIGDLISIESQEYDQGAGATPFHGELIVAFDPKTFTGGDAEQHAQRAERMFDAVVSQGARIPSQRRYEARARSLSAGTVSIPGDLYDEIQSLLQA
jgi:LDH2 family malate/lactate/ureidoglycolate dehydrogenase